MSSELNPLADPSSSSKDSTDKESEEVKSTAKKLLKFAGTWKGDDLEACLDEVYKTRGETTFS